MAAGTSEWLEALDALLTRGTRARDTIRPAEPRGGAVEGAPSLAADDWSVSRRIVYDQAMVNRWKTDALRFLREHHASLDASGENALTEMQGIIDRAGVLWRAVDPGLALLRRLKHDREGATE